MEISLALQNKKKSKMYERVDKTRSLYDLYNNRYNIREITVSL